MRKQKRMSDERLMEILQKACDDYEGDGGVLESAIGALVWGRVVGWHALRLMHTGRTFKKYEEILGVKLKEVLPERTEESLRMNGLRLAANIGKYWQVVTSGLVPAKKAAQVYIDTGT
jgi:hypothetical protein